MQTFLPSRSFSRSARLLDSKRLGKQRVEVLQILRALHLEDYGWRHHPVVVMWRGHTEALVRYGVDVSREWLRRGYGDTVLAQLVEFVAGQAPRSQRELSERGLLPPWLGRRDFHLSHRSALLRKNPEFYGPLFPGVPADLPYVWPVTDPPPATTEQPDASPRLAAWVARPATAAALARFRRDGFVALPALERRAKSPRSKAARQVATFRDEPRVGDALVVPFDGRLLVGEIASHYRRVARSPAPHVRSAIWLGEIPRHVLELPGRLQDPRLFFALRGEPDPRDLLARLTASPSS